MTSIDGPSIAVGLYVGLLGYVAGRLVGLDESLLRIGCLLVALGVAFAIRNRSEIWIELGRRRLLGVPMAVPLTLVVLLTVGTELDTGPDVSLDVLWWTLGLAVAGIAIWIAGHIVYADRAAGESHASWTARTDPARHRRRIAAAALGGAGSVVAFVGTVLYGVPTFVLSGGVAFTVATWISADRPRAYEACEHGLRYAEVGAVGSRFVPWDRFDGFRETDDAVVLERRWWVDERMRAEQVPPPAREALRRGVDRSESGP